MNKTEVKRTEIKTNIPLYIAIRLRSKENFGSEIWLPLPATQEQFLTAVDSVCECWDDLNIEGMNCRLMPHIRTKEDLGIAYLGNPHASVVPILSENRIDRAEYGRKLAELEGGVFTPLGYFVPVKNEGRKR